MAKKVLIVDDSALMRKHLSQILLSTAGFEVETARNGKEGLEKIKTFKPDVVTLDINMPVMDGLVCLSHIMTEMPCPVVMVSSLTEKGALATFEALEMGAVDFVTKPGGTVSLNIHDVEKELIAKVKAASRVRINNSKPGSKKHTIATPRAKIKKVSTQLAFDGRLIVIGVSTGGPSTLENILTSLPADFSVPILIAQHMPGRFTQVFAQRLNKLCAVTVSEVDRAVELLPANIYIAKGDADVKIIKRANRIMATSMPVNKKYLWHPSVELMVDSVAAILEPKKVICVQLTGMGNDGAKPMAEISNRGARTIAESESSAVVFGMPKELIALNGADKILPAKQIARQLIGWV